MTPPPILAGGGLSLLVNIRPALLTEYAPVTVINTSLTDTIYLASDSNVSPAAGVPVAPSTAYVWQTPGPLYAVADPSTAGVVPVILTGSSDAWQPSPVAVGAAIGAQLAEQGIVSRLTLTDLGVWNVPAGAPGTVFVDPTTRGLPALTSFGSVLVVAAGSVPATGPLLFAWQPAAGGTIVDGPTNLPLDKFGNCSVTLPVVADVLSFQVFNIATTATVHLYGYNQRLSDKPLGSGTSLMGFSARANVAAGSAQTTPFTVYAGEFFQGPAQCYVLANYLTAHSIQPMTINLAFNGVTDLFQLVRCDTQLSAVGNGTAYEGYFQRALPAGPFDLQLRMGVASSSFTDLGLLFQAIPL